MITNIIVWLTLSITTNTTGLTLPVSPDERIQSNVVARITTYSFLDPLNGDQISVAVTNNLSKVVSREKMHWVPVPLVDTNLHRMPPMPPVLLSNNVPVQGSPPSPKVSRVEIDVDMLPLSAYKLPGTPANLERARRTMP